MVTKRKKKVFTSVLHTRKSQLPAPTNYNQVKTSNMHCVGSSTATKLTCGK